MSDPRRKSVPTTRRSRRSPVARASFLGVLMGIAIAAAACDGVVLPSGIGSNLPSGLPSVGPLPTLPDRSERPTPEPTAEPTPQPTAETTPEVTAEATPTPTAESTPTPTAEATPTPTAEATPESTPEQTSAATPTPTAEATPESTPEQTPAATPEQTPGPTPVPTAQPTPEPTGDATTPLLLFVILAGAAVGIAIWAIRSRNAGSGPGAPPTDGPEPTAPAGPDGSDEDLGSLVGDRGTAVGPPDAVPTRVEGPPASGSDPTAADGDSPRSP